MAVLSAVVIGLLLISRNRTHVYAVGWLVVLLLIGLSFIVSEVRWDVSCASPRYYLAFLLSGVVVLQSVSLLGLQLIHFTGNTIYQQNCAPSSVLEDIRVNIPVGEKVITSNGLALYSLRENNMVYWPAGLSGVTAGGVPFVARYDDSFKWLITDQPLDGQTNFGAKFSWNANTHQYFSTHFVLLKKIGNQDQCFSKSPLARFSTISLPIYIYHYE